MSAYYGMAELLADRMAARLGIDWPTVDPDDPPPAVAAAIRPGHPPLSPRTRAPVNT